MTSSFLSAQWVLPDSTEDVLSDMWFEVPNLGRSSQLVSDHPCTPDSIPIPANEFFGITSDGQYYMGEVNSNPHYITDPNEMEHTQYEFQNVDGDYVTFRYLKLVNPYEEEEDPDALVASGPDDVLTSSPLTVQEIGELSIASNDLVDQGNVVLTLFADYFNSSYTSYQLCYEGDVEFYPIPFPLEPSNLVNASTPNTGSVIASAQLGAEFSWQPGGQYCATVIPSDSGLPVFLNFGVHLGQSWTGDVTFTVSGLTAPGQPWVDLSAVSEAANINTSVCIAGEFNDPNFTELQCVWIDEDGNKYGRYHVECYNDGNAGFDSLTMSLVLPDSAIASTVQVDRVMAQCNLRCRSDIAGEEYITSIANEDDLLNGGRVLVLSFDRGLCAYDDAHVDQDSACRFTAWFEFTVQFTGNTDLVFGDLHPGQPTTTFVSTDYDITPYYQDRICYTDSLLRQVISLEKKRRTSTRNQVMNNYQQILGDSTSRCRLGRVVSSGNCGTDCLDAPSYVLCEEEPEEPCWMLPVVAVVFLVLLYLFFRRRRELG